MKGALVSGSRRRQVVAISAATPTRVRPGQAVQSEAAPVRPGHKVAFGVHRRPELHLRRPHIELCSKRTALVLLCVAQFMVILDVSIVNVALPSIRRDLHVSVVNLQWVVDAYALAFGGFLLLGGRAADLLGRRRVFIAGLALFSGASLVGGLSGSIGMLTAARALQGLGAAIVSPATLSILTTTFTDPGERRRAMGVWSAVAAAGGAVGVLLGGVLTELLSWPWVLFVNVPIGLGAIAVSRRAIRSEPPLASSDFDLAGAVTVTGGLVAIVFAIVRSQAWGFASPRTVGVFAVGVILLGWFVLQEHRIAAHPLVPLRVFASRSLSTANVAMFFVGCAMFSTFFFVAFYMQQVRGLSPIGAGVATVPIGLSIIIGSTLATRVLAHTGPKPPLVTGMLLISTGMLLFSQLSVHGQFATTVLPAELAFGLGTGLAFVPATIAAVAGVPAEEAGLASGLINMSRSVGGSLGLAVLGTVAADRSSDLLTGHAHTLAAVDGALTNGFTRAFAIAAALALTAAVTSLLGLSQTPRAPSASEPELAEIAA
jgi:EmrB/QacA subfamily drug resistance transporter